MKSFLRNTILNIRLRKLSKKAIFGKKFIINKESRVYSTHKRNVQFDDNIMYFGCIHQAGEGKVKVGSNTSIRIGCKLFCSKSIIIGKNVIFADNIIVSDTNHHPVNPKDRLIMIESGWSTDLWSWKYADSAEIMIEDNVWIGQYSRILKGVKIGENSIIASNSVVSKDVPKNSIVAGNPAKVVKSNIDQVERKFQD